VANEYAPEHLIIQVSQPRAASSDVTTAGSVFLGRWTPESVGDYCSGTNHVLPTYGYARAYSGLSLADFQRRMTVQEVSLSGLRGLAPTVQTLATLEGLTAHAQAVTVRLDAADTRP
jgi:histidinol dehydrogenase